MINTDVHQLIDPIYCAGQYHYVLFPTFSPSFSVPFLLSVLGLPPSFTCSLQYLYHLTELGKWEFVASRSWVSVGGAGGDNVSWVNTAEKQYRAFTTDMFLLSVININMSFVLCYFQSCCARLNYRVTPCIQSCYTSYFSFQMCGIRVLEFVGSLIFVQYVCSVLMINVVFTQIRKPKLVLWLSQLQCFCLYHCLFIKNLSTSRLQHI